MRLALHLEHHQSVIFSDHANIEEVLSIENHSTLTGWFVANRNFPSARDISCIDFPENFVWDKSSENGSNEPKDLVA